ncbi:hypothetical protein PGT21_017184 [Puccinia graminis f. sp. tritici]|uniref:Uncharacterized protein n=1 Tax=Puccinia graminis f. sp. tritici TaxID=56615 RepID=A0A5B0LPH2_PUCGR|nr:hypothetical protein PGT21_017184 [Puccinia graminis f. sp. tritici]
MRRAVVWVKYQSSRPLNTAPRPQRLAIGHWARNDPGPSTGMAAVFFGEPSDRPPPCLKAA